MGFSVPILNLAFYVNMSAYHLNKVEVMYELKIRKLSTEGTTEECRKRLSEGLASNTPISEAVVNSLDPETELDECEGIYLDMSVIVRDYEGNYDDVEYCRIVARLWHLYVRVDRIPIGAARDNELEKSKEALLSICKELLDSFLDGSNINVDFEEGQDMDCLSQLEPDSLEFNLSYPTKLPSTLFNIEEDREEEERSSFTNIHQCQEAHKQPYKEQDSIASQHESLLRQEMDTRLHQYRRQTEILDGNENMREFKVESKPKEENGEGTWKQQDDQLKLREKLLQDENLKNNYQEQEFRRWPRERNSSSRSGYVPVYKWGLRFDNSGPSIASFLERVEELRRARGVTHVELYKSAVDLFDGPVLVWYRAVADSIHSWHQLTEELRKVFQPPDYGLRLQHEIYHRVQGDGEPIDLYIAAVEGLYRRLGTPVPETTRLAQIYYNLHPQLQDRLALCNIQTLEQLRSLGRRAESGLYSRTTGRHNCLKNVPTLEPDLAYQEHNPYRGFPRRLEANKPKLQQGCQRLMSWYCKEQCH